MNSKISATWAWLSLIGSVVPLAIGIRHYLKAKKQHDWIVVTGRITSSEVKWEGELQVPRVTYHYEVGTHLFIGNIVKSGLISTSSRGAAKEICAQYAVNSEVRVYVDPLDPSQAVLEPGGDWKFLPFMCCFSAILLLLGYMLLRS